MLSSLRTLLQNAREVAIEGIHDVRDLLILLSFIQPRIDMTKANEEKEDIGEDEIITIEVEEEVGGHLHSEISRSPLPRSTVGLVWDLSSRETLLACQILLQLVTSPKIVKLLLLEGAYDLIVQAILQYHHRCETMELSGQPQSGKHDLR